MNKSYNALTEKNITIKKTINHYVYIFKLKYFFMKKMIIKRKDLKLLII